MLGQNFRDSTYLSWLVAENALGKAKEENDVLRDTPYRLPKESVGFGGTLLRQERGNVTVDCYRPFKSLTDAS
jgi:hypothetical protein